MSDPGIPEGQDFVYCAPTPQDLGLPEPTIDDAIGLASDLPFIQSMRLLSVLAGAAFHARTNLDRQRYLATVVYEPRPDLQRAVLGWLDEGPNRLAFDPRHIAALQRFVVLHAADASTDWLPQHQELLIGALLGVAGALPHGEPSEDPLTEESSMAEWTRYLVQVGLYYEQPWVAETLARSWARCVTVAADLGDRKEACEIDEWLAADYKFTRSEQVGLGLAYAHGSGAIDEGLSIEQRGGRRPGPGFLSETALADRERDAVDLISADRDQLRAILQAEGDDPMRVAWDHAAFDAKPFLRDEEGFLLLHSPPALMSWMTRGLHYRALDAANRRRDGSGKKLGGQWLQYAGSLGEESVRRLLAGSVPSDGSRGTLTGEIRFGPGGQNHSSDAAFEVWPDLALFEVYSGRFSREAKSGDAAKLTDAIRRATVEKIEEVLARADDVLASPPRFVYPSETPQPNRVWPIVVLAGDTIAPTPMFWRWLREEVGLRLTSELDGRIRGPLVVDLDDIEPLLGLMEAGHPFFQMLEGFLRSDLAEFPMRNWLAREFDLTEVDRPAYVREQWQLAVRAGGSRLYPNSTKLADALDGDERTDV